MGDPVWLADTLRAEGVTTIEYGDWKNIGHGDFGTIWGVMAHHTGGNASAGAIQNSSNLGLCSQIFLNRAGVAYVVGAGVAWHAGEGSWPGIPANNANQVTIGIEAENNGTEGWTPIQYWAYVKVCAAILRKLGLNESRLIAHKEWAGKTQGKWDPGGIDMKGFRRDVRAQLNGGAVVQVNKINEMYASAGGDKGWLGRRVTTGELTTPDGRGRFVQFAGGYIYWTPELGAIPVPMHVFETWAGLGFEKGPLGYPVKYHSVLAGVGDVQAFEKGVIYRKYGQPGFYVTGKIGDRWYSEKAEKGPRGWPKSNEIKLKDGGVRQDFDGDPLFFHPSGAVDPKAA